MSICVAFNLSDGVVMAVDSATTIFDASGAISKVFVDADKIFRLKDMGVGVATYGGASLHGRTIGSFIREFTAAPDNADLADLPLSDVVERLRKFVHSYYISYFEQIHSMPFDQIPANMKGQIGLIVGGFSSGSLQSELWEIVIPVHAAENSATQHFSPGNYGCRWFALAMPINRYANALDPRLSAKLKEVFEEILGRELTDEDKEKFAAAIEQYRYRFNFDGMPIQSGIDCARFLVDLVLGHYRFAETHPIVGGKAKIGVVTYDQNAFRILD
jgi:hypothetical protein